MMQTFRSLARGVLLTAALLSAGATNAQSKPNLVGQWVSEAAEPGGGVFATRAFTITDKEWKVVYRVFADAQAQLALFTLNVGGIYVVGNPSTRVAGAYEGIFPANHRHITAESEAGVKMFSSMGCALEKGQETPLVDKPCGFVPPLMQAMGEYDLIALQRSKLYWGDRSGDLTKARPDKLTAFPLVRKQ